MAAYWEVQANGTDLLVCVPHAAVTPLTMDWVGNLLAMEKVGVHKLDCWKGLPVHIARNQLCQDALDLKVKYVFFLDADVIPPLNAIPRLMYWRVPIVSGLYYSKRGHPGAWVLDPDLSGKYLPLELEKLKFDGLVKVDALPMGCCLIDTRVLKVIPFPWFDWTAMTPKSLEGRSEDFEFSKRAQEHGFRLFVDKGLRCKHETIVPLDPEGEADSDALTASRMVPIGG